MGGIAPGRSPVRANSPWLWLALVGLASAAVFSGGTPPGGLYDIAEPAAWRLFHGNFTIMSYEVWAIIAVAGWAVMKPLALIGGVLLLELHFCPPIKRQNLIHAWIAQAVALQISTGLVLAAKFYNGGVPEPLIRIEATQSPLALIFVQMPAVFLALLTLGFFQYWFHRACHRVPWLWRYHSLHHCMNLNTLDNISHPFETVISIVLVTVPTVLLIHASSDQVIVLAVFIHLQGYVSHSVLPVHFGPLRFLLCDNRYHFIHHSLDPAHHGKNFANTPIWDWVFGTYFPAQPNLVPTGLADRAPPETLKQYLTVKLPPRRAAGADQPQVPPSQLNALSLPGAAG